MTLRLADILDSLASEFDARLFGDPDLMIDRLSPLEYATSHDLSFLSHPQYAGKLTQSAAGCVIVAPAAEEAAAARGSFIVVADPYHYFARVTQLWKLRHAAQESAGVHPSAFVHPSASVAADAFVGPFAFIAAGAQVEAGARIGAHCDIGRNTLVGAHTRLAARVTLADGCRIGARGIVHSGAVIGADGFGFAPHGGTWVKIEQLGGVRIGDDVEIGANTCIDRGALQDTVIEDGVKLDNLVQIGHNVHVGKHTAMAGCAGVAGSATIGAHCTIGGGAIVLGHLSLADHVHVSAASVVTRSILKPGNYTGFFPIDDNKAWEKNAVTLKQLHQLRDRLKQAEHALAKLEEKS